MSFDSVEALRRAGILGGAISPQLEVFFSGLSEEETELLVKLKNKLVASLPEVVAHSQDWAKPEATAEGHDAAMLCACGVWSGSGSSL
jgi:hypothetical protein